MIGIRYNRCTKTNQSLTIYVSIVIESLSRDISNEMGFTYPHFRLIQYRQFTSKDGRSPFWQLNAIYRLLIFLLSPMVLERDAKGHPSFDVQNMRAKRGRPRNVIIAIVTITYHLFCSKQYVSSLSFGSGHNFVSLNLSKLNGNCNETRTTLFSIPFILAFSEIYPPRSVFNKHLSHHNRHVFFLPPRGLLVACCVTTICDPEKMSCFAKRCRQLSQNKTTASYSKLCVIVNSAELRIFAI